MLSGFFLVLSNLLLITMATTVSSTKGPNYPLISSRSKYSPQLQQLYGKKVFIQKSIQKLTKDLDEKIQTIKHYTQLINLAKEVQSGKEMLVPVSDQMFADSVLQSDMLGVLVGCGVSIDMSPEEAISFSKKIIEQLKSEAVKIHQMLSVYQLSLRSNDAEIQKLDC